MSRHFSFRSAPTGAQRGGRYTVANATKIGAPVVVSGVSAIDSDALAVVPAGDVAAPDAGMGGVLVYEELFTDAAIDSPDDVVDAPAGSHVQVVRGEEVKIVLTNTADYDIFTFGTLAVGDPVGVSAGGLWVEDAVNPWGTVTQVLSSAADAESIEVQLNF